MSEASPVLRPYKILIPLGFSVAAASGCGRTVVPQPAQAASALAITRQQVATAVHTFEPSAPPPEMPPLAPDEQAQCDSDFVSNASVAGKSEKIDATHAIVTVTRVQMTLQLRINIWVPQGVSQKVMDHEEGHRQISEHFFQDANRIAERIASGYVGKQVPVSGTDLGAEINKALQNLSAEITAEYSRRVSPEPAQQRFDDLTDHARNDLSATDAILEALKGTA
jgi:hypothetical protein